MPNPSIILKVLTLDTVLILFSGIITFTITLVLFNKLAKDIEPKEKIDRLYHIMHTLGVYILAYELGKLLFVIITSLL